MSVYFVSALVLPAKAIYMFLLLPYSMSTMVHGCVNSQPHCKYKCTLYLATYSVQYTLPIQIKNVTAHLHKNKVQSALPSS